ncbi:uncharacterized protein [Leptinotarsa decemlineata]|uniref:uncharacterized protein n=1 Tax=Leptinotarsa decemlineata TaxID=7539 RepID=UPI003D30A17F
MFRMFCCWRRKNSNDDQNLVEQNSGNQPTSNESTPPRVTSSRTNPSDSEDTTVQETGLQNDSNIGPESSQSREDSISESLTSTLLYFSDSEDIRTEEGQHRPRSVSIITIRGDAESLRGDAEYVEGIMSPPADTRNPGPSSSEIVIKPEDLETELQSTHRSRTNSETSSFYSVRSSQSTPSSGSGDCDFYSVYSVDTGQST